MTGPRPPLAAGVLVALAAVAATTAVVFPLESVTPVASLSVVYLVAVLLVASVWGGWLGVLTALAGALAFNWFHLPPTGRFTIAEGQNWVALAVFFTASLVVSRLATTARARAAEAQARRQEADLSAELARLLLRGERPHDALPAVSHRLAQALELPSADVELGPVATDQRRVAFPLREGPAEVGALVVPAGLPEATLARLQQRVVPALEALLAAALERDRLLNDVVETAALRRSDVLKTALLRSVGHDLRTPLTAILASADALQSAALQPGELQELTAGMETEARRLAHLIDDLLDLSKLEAQAAEPHLQTVAVEEVLHAAALDVAAPEGAITFAIDPDLPPVRADAAQLRRAFANLLENAVRHGAGHPVSVRGRDVGRRILIRVVDRGPGIPPAQLERVFEPFHRGGTAQTGHRGSGLGLAIVRGFVEVNGGRVWAESLPGQATAFVVELPLETPAPAPA